MKRRVDVPGRQKVDQFGTSTGPRWREPAFLDPALRR